MLYDLVLMSTLISKLYIPLFDINRLNTVFRVTRTELIKTYNNLICVISMFNYLWTTEVKMKKFAQIFGIGLVLCLCACKHDVLPFINIHKGEAIGWGAKESCLIKYTDLRGTVELEGKIKCRGGLSSKYDKHSFSLELDEGYAMGYLPKDDDWIINANYIDKTFMRHKICYDLFNEMNPQNVAAGCSYVKVAINDVYQGLYVLMEEVNAGMIGLNKQDSMAMLFKGPPIFSTKKGPTKSTAFDRYHQKYPKIDKSDKTAYLAEFANFMHYSSDVDFAKNISQWVDIDNIMDWHILLLFSNNTDGIAKNLYLYKKDNDTPFRIAIWDYDHSFGRDGDNELSFWGKKIKCESSILVKRLMEIEQTGYRSKLKQRWLELREQGILSVESFRTKMQANKKIIDGEVAGNFKKWPVNGSWYFDDNSFDQELKLMFLFAQIRIKQLDLYFKDLE